MSESSGPGLTYRAFISYSHRDKTWGDWLHKALETYWVPSRLAGKETAAGIIPRRLHPVFRDREELASATDLGRKVNEALAQSEALIVICSPAAAASRWVNEEVLAFKRMGRGERVFCLIVDGEPNATDLPGREVEECFCPALRYQLDANGQTTNERAEPIAADARPGKDGKANAKLKLIAGMLDVGFDALKQREQHRRMRRMTAITALAVCVMAVTIVLAVFALISRHEAVLAQSKAVIAQHRAVVAQQAAERRQKRAEDLVDFMLGDLSTKLRRVDRLDALSTVDDKAMAYFKSLPATDVNGTELAQRARTLQKIGEVRMDRSRLPDAMKAFQQALRLNKQLADTSPDNPLSQNAYAENLLWVGFADWNEGKLDLAEQAFRQSAAALERAASLAPSNNDIAHNLDEVYNNLGHVAQTRGDLDFATRDYGRDQLLCQRMAASHPSDVDWQDALGGSYENLATIALMHGQLDSAIHGYLQEQHLLAQVVAQHPQNVQIQDDLIRSDALLGHTLALAGRTQAGIAHVEAALAIGKSRLKFDPSHNGWRDKYAYHSALLRTLQMGERKPAPAGAPIGNAIATLRALVAKDPSNTEWAGDLAEAEMAGARLARVRRQPAKAERLAEAALKSVQKPLSDNPSSTNSLRDEASIELMLAQLAGGAGRTGAATRHRQQALALIRRISAHSSDPRTLAVLVEVLLASGKRQEAKPYVLDLQKMGYRPTGFIVLLQKNGIGYPANPQFDSRVAQLLQSGGSGSDATSARR
jgi:tetratricopeptide (TPR) repeat protein